MTAGDVPLPFMAPSPSLAELISSHRKLLASLKSFEPSRVIAIVAGLMTVPEWQSSTLRLEALQHLNVFAAAGAKKVKKSHLRDWLNDLGSSSVGAMEDPAEDVHVSRVLIPGKDCLILEGVYESAAFHAQRFVNLLDEMPDEGNYLLLKRSVYALLRLSNELARRSGLSAFDLGSQSPVRHVSESMLGNIARLCARVTFSMEELHALGIDLRDLRVFIFDPAWRGDIAKEHIGHSSLERYPLVLLNGSLYFALPTATSMTIRRLILEAFAGDSARMLYAAYQREMSAMLSGMPFLGGSVGAPIDFQRRNGIYICNVARFIDEGRLLHVCIILDDVTTFAASGMIAPDPDAKRLSDIIEASVAHAYEDFSGRASFREGLSLVVMCPWGRPMVLDVSRPSDARWRFETISAADLETMSWETSFSPLSLWRLLDGRDRLAAHNVHLLNMNGLLNLYGWAESLEGHLVPHGQVPKNYVAGDSLHVMITQNALLQIRRRLAVTWNLHQSTTWDQRTVKVRRETISSYFEEDKLAPIYVSMDDIKEGRLCSVYETEDRKWWTTINASGLSTKSLTYGLWHLTSIWMRRAAPVLERILPSLPRGSILWLTHFEDSGGVSHDGPIPTREVARRSLRVEIIRNEIHVHAGPEFFDACRNSENVGESLLVEFLVRGALLLARSPDMDEVDRALAEIVPDVWARDMHLVPAREFRDYMRDVIPGRPVLISRTDDATLRVGLGWLSRKAGDGSRIVGVEECCQYLGSVVDAVWQKMKAELRQYDREKLILELIRNHESVMIETDSWMRSARAMLSLHVNKEETALVSARRIGRYNASALTTRIVLEMAICECPSQGGRVAGSLDIARLLAQALQLHQYGGWSEAIRFEGKEAEIRITPLGDIYTNTGFDNEVAGRYGEALGVKRFHGGAKAYEGNFKLPELVKSARPSMEPEFWNAWEEVFGFTIDDVRVFMDNLENYAISRKEYVFSVSLGELEAMNASGVLASEKVVAILNALTLKPRSSWDSTPEGFLSRDWYPWRFRRRLSIVCRPILCLTDIPEPRYLVAPGIVRNGVMKLLDYCYRGGFEAKDFPAGLMRSWIGAAENRRGHEFNRKVASLLEHCGWEAKTDLKVTELLNDKTDRDYGDVDVLAWRGSRILAIECKDLELAMTVGEIARQIFEFRGQDDKKGRPDRLKRHLLRYSVLTQRQADVRRFTGIQGEAKIEAVLVFSELVPMGFSRVAARHNVSILTIDEIATLQ